MPQNTLLRTTTAASATRMGPALHYAFDQSTALASLSLFLKYRDTDQPVIAYTDGTIVTTGALFESALTTIGDRAFATLHEIMHCALAHPIRGRQLHRRRNAFRPDLWNIACDAIINGGLSLTFGPKRTRYPIPTGLICLEATLKTLKAWPGNLEDALSAWNSERLYDALVAYAAERSASCPSCTPGARNETDGSGDPNAHGEASSGAGVTLPPGAHPIDLTPFVSGGKGDGGCTLHEAAGHPNEQAENDAIRKWADRITSAAGRMPGLLERFFGDMPAVTTPWEELLRRFCAKALLRRRHHADYTRLSRRYTALEMPMRRYERVELPIEPGRRPLPAPRLAIAVDTSGSIDDAMLARFTAEICRIVRQTHAQIRLIVADAAVHQVEDFNEHDAIKRLREFRYQGGGGTDFKPAIALAADYHPDALVYLTDLFGDCGDQPSFPVLWACISDARAPWGKHVRLEV